MNPSRWCPILSSAKDGCICPDHALSDGWLRAADNRAGQHERSPPWDMREAIPPEKTAPPPLKLAGIGNAHIHITATSRGADVVLIKA